MADDDDPVGPVSSRAESCVVRELVDVAIFRGARKRERP